MQEKTVWFGTEDDLVQVKCPSTELTRTRVAWRNSGTYLNGGGFALSSGTAHEEASISWGADSVDGFATLMTQLNKGESLYYLDPLACKTNILPPYAAQYQPNNPFGFVAESATGANGYPSTALKSLYTDRQIATIPVPEGYRLWVGCKGSSGGVSVDAPPPEGVEVGRNLLNVPQTQAGTNVGLASNSAGSSLVPPFSVVDLSAPSGTKYSTQRTAQPGVTSMPAQSALYLSDRSLTIPATPGEERIFKASFYSVEALSVELRALYLREDGSEVTAGRSGALGIPAGEWTQLAFSSVAQPESVKCRLGIYNMGGELALSDSSLFKTDAWAFLTADSPWFSGDHAPEGPFKTEWLGEPNNSVSVLYESEGHPSDPEIPATSPNSGKRVTHSYPGGRAYHLFVQGGSVLQGVMAQILPNGVEPSTGGFIPGMGFSALALQDNPQITEYSAVLENYQMAMTASFIEVGSWM